MIVISVVLTACMISNYYYYYYCYYCYYHCYCSYYSRRRRHRTSEVTPWPAKTTIRVRTILRLPLLIFIGVHCQVQTQLIVLACHVGSVSVVRRRDPFRTSLTSLGIHPGDRKNAYTVVSSCFTEALGYAVARS